MTLNNMSIHRTPLERLVQITWVAALIVVVSASLAPGSDIPVPMEVNDKVLHFIAYFGLGVLGGTGWPERRGLFLVALPLLGLGLECVQGGLIAGRQFDWMDAVANAVGAVVGVAASLVTRRVMFKSA